MTSPEPGERRRLDRPPSTRYADSAAPDRAPSRSALPGPLLRALVAATLGAAAIVLVGAVLASTFGLLFVGGVTGAVIGLVLARAAVPGTGARPSSRASLTRIGVGLALVAVAAGYLGIWAYGLGEGGTLGLVDYLSTAFGLFVPGVALVAAAAAAWGAGAGPVQR